LCQKSIYSTHDSHFNKGDKCFLFSYFPLNSSLYEKLPLNIFKGVSIVKTPSYALNYAEGKFSDQCENVALAAYVYPEYVLKCGVVHACIKIDKDTQEKDVLFWLISGAFSIIKPIFLNTSGAFIYGDQDGFICKPEKLVYKSNLSLDAIKQQCNFNNNLLCYDENDLKLLKILLLKIHYVFRSRQAKPRPFYNLLTFFQLTFWEKLNYESSLFSKMFPFLDSFSGNPSKQQSKNVSSRIANFLQNIPYLADKKQFTKEIINDHLKYIWEYHRYPELHGHLKLPKSQQPNDQLNLLNSDFKFTKDLLDLFEISRLCIYKMLLLSKKDFEFYSKIPIPPLGLSMQEANNDNKQRDSEAELFFEKTYDNPPELISFLDLTTKQ